MTFINYINMIPNIKHHNMEDSEKKEQQIILNAISSTLKELECTRNLFEYTNEPKLVEMAIYLEEALKAKYSYLLDEAKRLGITYKNIT